MSNTERIFQAPCDFCNATTTARVVYDAWQAFSWLEPIDGSGSDHLAIWCQSCGPKHRERNTAPALDPEEYPPFTCPKCNELKPFTQGSGDCQTCTTCCTCTGDGTYCMPY